MSTQQPESGPVAGPEADVHDGRTTVHEPVLDDGAPRRHPVNVSHLVMGTAFVLISLIAFGLALGVVDAHDLRWLLPVPWIAAGAAGLTASALRSVRRADPPAPGPGGR